MSKVLFNSTIGKTIDHQKSIENNSAAQPFQNVPVRSPVKMNPTIQNRLWC